MIGLVTGYDLVALLGALAVFAAFVAGVSVGRRSR